VRRGDAGAGMAGARIEPARRSFKRRRPGSG
jgi:hypothetical protein